jgi:hypothetical protein
VKTYNIIQLAQAMQTIEGVMYLLKISNHSEHPASAYAHHIRDRLSESIVTELATAHQKIDETRKVILSEMSEEELAAHKSNIPF